MIQSITLDSVSILTNEVQPLLPPLRSLLVNVVFWDYSAVFYIELGPGILWLDGPLRRHNVILVYKRDEYTSEYISSILTLQPLIGFKEGKIEKRDLVVFLLYYQHIGMRSYQIFILQIQFENRNFEAVMKDNTLNFWNKVVYNNYDNHI